MQAEFVEAGKKRLRRALQLGETEPLFAGAVKVEQGQSPGSGGETSSITAGRGAAKRIMIQFPCQSGAAFAPGYEAGVSPRRFRARPQCPLTVMDP